MEAQITKDHIETARGLGWMINRFEWVLRWNGVLRNAKVKQATDTAARILAGKPVDKDEVLNMCNQVQAIGLFLEWKARGK